MSPRFGCKGERAHLAAYLDERCDATERLAFDHHLESCADCRRAVAFEESVEEALHRGVGPDFDADYEQRVLTGMWERIDRDAAPAPTAKPAVLSKPARREKPVSLAMPRPWIFVTLAAAAIVLTIALWKGRTDPSGAVGPGLRDVAASDPHSIDRAGDSAPSESAINTANDTAIDIDALREVRRRVRETLTRVALERETPSVVPPEFAELASEKWPVPSLLRAAIDDPDPAVAIGAMRVAVLADIASCAPAMRRAAKRQGTAATAIECLGRIGDLESVDLIERAMRSAELAPAAIAALEYLGGDESITRLVAVLDDPKNAEQALDALLALGAPGLGELLVRASHGDVFVADALAARSSITLDRLEEILRTGVDPRRVNAAIDRASRFGDRAIPALLPLVSVSMVRDAALAALVEIGTAPALEALLAATARQSLHPVLASRTVRAILRGFLDPAASAARIAASEHGPTFVSLLLAPEAIDEAAEVLGTIVAVPRIALLTRIDIAFALVDHELLDADVAVALAAEAVASGRHALAARALIAAARSGANLDSLTRAREGSSLADVCEKAEQLAARWRRDGAPPADAEQANLVRRIERALP